MKTNQKGFSIIEILIVVIVLGLIGGASWWVWQKNKPKTTNNIPSTHSSKKATETATNSSITTLTNGMKLELITTSNFTDDLLDKNDERHSYQVQAALYFMDGSKVTHNYQQLIKNLDDGSWLIDGEKASALPFVREAVKREVTPIMGLSLLTTDLFGVQDYFQNNERIAYFSLNQRIVEDTKNTSENDWEYEIKSSAPASEGFDYKTKIFDVLRAHPDRILFTIVASE